MNNHRSRYGLAGVVCTLAISTLHGQQASLIIPVFPTATVQRNEDTGGDLTARWEFDADALNIIVSSKTGRAPNGGWAGACIQNGTETNLRNYTHAIVSLSTSAAVMIDLKLERTNAGQGTLWLKDAQPVKPTDKALTIALAGADNRGPMPTLDAARRLCLFVLANGYPAAREVRIRVTRVLFDKRGNT